MKIIPKDADGVGRMVSAARPALRSLGRSEPLPTKHEPLHVEAALLKDGAAICTTPLARPLDRPPTAAAIVQNDCSSVALPSPREVFVKSRGTPTDDNDAMNGLPRGGSRYRRERGGHVASVSETAPPESIGKDFPTIRGMAVGQRHSLMSPGVARNYAPAAMMARRTPERWRITLASGSPRPARVSVRPLK